MLLDSWFESLSAIMWTWITCLRGLSQLGSYWGWGVYMSKEKSSYLYSLTVNMKHTSNLVADYCSVFAQVLWCLHEQSCNGRCERQQILNTELYSFTTILPHNCKFLLCSGRKQLSALIACTVFLSLNHTYTQFRLSYHYSWKELRYS